MEWHGEKGKEGIVQTLQHAVLQICITAIILQTESLPERRKVKGC